MLLEFLSNGWCVDILHIHKSMMHQVRMFSGLMCCTWSRKILISSLSWSITVWESLLASRPPPSLSFFSRRHMWSSRNLTIIRLEWMNLSFWVRASSSWATFWSSIWVKSWTNVTPPASVLFTHTITCHSNISFYLLVFILLPPETDGSHELCFVKIIVVNLHGWTCEKKIFLVKYQHLC